MASPCRAGSGMLSQSERHWVRTPMISVALNYRLSSMEPLTLLRATVAALGLAATA